jgi:hypothetical protein
MTRGTPRRGAYAASAAATNAGFLAIPAYRCGVSHDHFCGFSAITFAGFHSIRNSHIHKDIEHFAQSPGIPMTGAEFGPEST